MALSFEPEGVLVKLSILKRCTALVGIATLLQPFVASATYAQYAASVTAQPASADPLVTQYFVSPSSAPQLSNAQMTQLIRNKIKYVFVIFNENQSFDHEYGTFPGVNGLYSTGQAPRSAANTPGFTQTYTDTYTGTTSTVQPFLLGPNENGTVIDSVDHGHTGLAAKLRVVNGVPTMAGFSQDEFSGKATSAANEAKGRQFANIVMSHVDCNTIPFYWQYASRFTIFDNIFATEDTPSTPNAIAMIAGQSGETQWVKHGSAGTTQALAGTINGTNFNGQTGTTQGPPFVNDPQPYWGSEFDTATTTNREPTGPSESFAKTNIASNATFASIPLTAAGASIKTIMAGDKNPAMDQADIQNDIPAIASHGTPTVAWRWYQNGYDHEPTDPTATATHNNFVTHHEGPQYFGYIANNSTEQPNLEGEGDFFTDIAAGKLPANGGIVYIRGGYANLQGLKPPIQNPAYPRALTPTDITTIQTVKAGDDDHPSYSDRQISEAMNARVINAIASNPTLWAQSAIIITYDESDGFYDHVPPRILSYGPDGLPLSRGIRVPLLLISPYSRVHAVSHAEGDHNAVIETINQIFNLPSLSGLPDEAAALAAGNSAAFNQYGPAGFQQKYLGPRDTNSAITDSLISGFDPNRLRGLSAALPASYVMIPDATVTSLPHYNGQGCSKIGITPEDQRQGIVNTVPTGFNPLAATLPQYNAPAP
jgi:phospholipase C